MFGLAMEVPVMRSIVLSGRNGTQSRYYSWRTARPIGIYCCDSHSFCRQCHEVLRVWEGWRSSIVHFLFAVEFVWITDGKYWSADYKLQGSWAFLPYEDEEDEDKYKQPDNQQQKKTSKTHAEAFLENQYEKSRLLLIWDTRRRGLAPLTESELNTRNVQPPQRWWEWSNLRKFKLSFHRADILI
jgi:hypothetical protein